MTAPSSVEILTTSQKVKVGKLPLLPQATPVTV